MRRALVWIGAGLLAALSAGAARAQEPAQEPPAETPQPAAERKAFTVRLRGGFGGYTGSFAPLTSVGPMWGVSVDFRTARWASLELAYEGAQNGLQDRSGTLIRSGGQLLGKLYCGRGGVFPYAGAGLGISFIDPSSSAEPFAQGDTVVEVPLVLGVDWGTGVLSFGVRAGYTLLVGANFLAPIAPDGRGGFASGSFLFGLGF